MKISIITLHSILNNYGSVLQGFALCKFLNNKGYDAQVIDYRPRYKTSMAGMLRSFVIKAVFLLDYMKRTQKFERFVDSNKLTKNQYKSYEELSQLPPESDVYIAGSDQIWNNLFPCGKDPAYYLEFVKSGVKMSYAASLGRDDVAEDDLLAIKEKIKDFKSILVREESGKKQLEKIGLKNVNHTADPVFLLSKEDYVDLIDHNKHKAGNEYKPYLLVYAVEQDDLLSNVVKGIAADLGLKVISIGGFSNKCECDKFDRTAGPEDFLNLINNAEFVVTSSFHCTAFSLIFKKNFAVILPHKNPARLENIVSIVGLENRIIRENNYNKDILKSIDYKEPDKVLNSYIENSKNILINTLEGIGNIKDKD